MKKFKKTYIEITNICNLSCSFCPPTKRLSQYMDIDTFTNILEQIKGYSKHLYFHVKGEPLLHPQLEKLLQISYEKEFYVNITTNGTLINLVKDKILEIPSLRQVNFSLHSFEDEKGSEKMLEYMNSIISFSKDAIKNNIIISLRLWNLQKDNATNTQKKKNRQMLEIIEKEFNLDFQIEEKVEPGKGIKIEERLYINQESQFNWPDLQIQEISSKGFCHGLRNQIAILVDGTVVPCCLDGEGIMDLGNLKNSSFKEIIESKKATDIYNSFSNGEVIEALCRKCGYRLRFSQVKS
ncbi:radical SAM protein with 4Fe4S-binding SPASM domain [Natranaerovirga pectinivora]|uniref:Radical SAM protein with 4Fe4S-binding SPASM domain n=1 Tax=Natranaerovirga pectinivora TaxID=682400 RepID=A0A4R3MRW5_9FIRM|nr:radical SAM/SPASM domain-containing protein [Natranaerovirga pectinivora]TCT16158.1 radical SAM protein with 4Fe4S-binding SPASM domain [Natranaerovirga pectinivora]